MKKGTWHKTHFFIERVISQLRKEGHWNSTICILEIHAYDSIIITMCIYNYLPNLEMFTCMLNSHIEIGQSELEILTCCFRCPVLQMRLVNLLFFSSQGFIMFIPNPKHQWLPWDSFFVDPGKDDPGSTFCVKERLFLGAVFLAADLIRPTTIKSCYSL